MAKKSAGGAGKFVNPTDKARKDARKKELKKNKKQRLAVRTNVIKSKDPHQILADMQRLDHMEFNVEQPSPLNEKVLSDKRRKLKETWDRVMHLYAKDDRDKFVQLKRLQDEYESERNEMKKHFDAVKSAQNVLLDEIPLPALPTAIPTTGQDVTPILKKAPSLTTYRSLTQKEPPGPPPGPPPRLSEFEDEDSESGKKVRFGPDSDVDEFLKEIADFVPPAANPAMSLPLAAVPPPAVIRHPLILLRPPLTAVPPPASLAAAPSALTLPPAGLRPGPGPGFPGSERRKVRSEHQLWTRTGMWQRLRRSRNSAISVPMRPDLHPFLCASKGRKSDPLLVQRRPVLRSVGRVSAVAVLQLDSIRKRRHTTTLCASYRDCCDRRQTRQRLGRRTGTDAGRSPQ